MKLQDAYVAESGYIGSWTSIGYVMKSTTVYDYSAPALTAEKTSVANAAGSAGWQAKSLGKLNDCDQNSTWTINVYEASSTNASGSMLDYEAVVAAGGNGTKAQCESLTPSFTKLTTKPASST